MLKVFFDLEMNKVSFGRNIERGVLVECVDLVILVVDVSV